MIGSPDLWPALLPVVEALEALGVPYHVGGSVASSFTGIARATQDADLVADLQGVLRLQGRRLDFDYLRRWADRLGVPDLLDRAFREAGLES